MYPETNFNFSNFFAPESFNHSAIFQGIIYPWEAVQRIIPFIRETLSLRKENTPLGEVKIEGLKFCRNSDGEEILFVLEGVKLSSPLFLPQADIYLGKGTILEPGSLIKSLVLIGEDCEIRQGAYIREGVITGNGCVLGHTTEIKNSILFNRVEAGHFAYIGDSILGSFVNLGAGTKLANLQLRTPAEKDSGKIKEIKIKVNQTIYTTGLNKLGAIIGDYGDIGCNTVTCPGTLLAKNCRVYPNTTVKKGYYPPDSIIRE